MPPKRLNRHGRHSSWHVRGGLGIVLALAACQLPTGSPTSEPTASGAASASVAATECPEIDLRTPAGARVDLTGTWTTGSVESGIQVVYELLQEGECLWGRAYSAFAGQEPAESFDIIVVGTIRSDFTVELDLLELGLGDPFAYTHFGRASATLGIAFEAAEGEEAITLPITALQARFLASGVAGRLFFGAGPEVGQVLIRPA